MTHLLSNECFHCSLRNSVLIFIKQETLAWAEITDLEKGKQAIALALNIPDDDEHKITEQVFDEIELDDLKMG